MLVLNTSWLTGLLASANERLDDPKVMRRWTAAILILGAALRFADVFYMGLRFKLN